MIRLWKGFHTDELQTLIREAWENNELLILCPPILRDFDFVRFLPDQQIKPVGQWDTESLGLLNYSLQKREMASITCAKTPVLGVFTSGTVSGSPRLVLYSKENIISSLEAIRFHFDISRIRAIFCYPQPFHAFGLVLGYLHSLLFGARLIIGHGKYSKSMHELWLTNANKRTLTLGTPVHFHDLINHCKEARISPWPSYTAIIGGARVSVALWHELRDILKIEKPSIGYGATEASPGITHLPPGLPPKEDGEIGYVLPGVSMQVEAELGVRFSGPNLCLAVIENGSIQFPESMLIPDVVERRRPENVFVYRGRNQLMVNRGGQKFSIELIEETMRQKLNLEAVCVPVADPRLGEDLGLLLRAKRGTSIAEKKAKALELISSEFGISLKPERVTHTLNIPLNDSSKIDRKRSHLIFQETAERRANESL